MAAPTTPPIFDGHNDVLSKLAATHPCDAVASFRANAHQAIDLRRARLGGFAGGFFAVWVPSPSLSLDQPTSGAEFNIPLPPEVRQVDALPAAMKQVAILLDLERAGCLAIATSVAAIEEAMTVGRLAAALHIEGAEAIDADLDVLDVLHAAGLRSLGPVWSRPNRFGHGVPFRFPSTPDTGPGLTGDGKRLVDRCNALGIMVDLSHITEQGFWDVAARTTKPLVATHSNAHALCPTARNLTDRQLDAIAESHGMVGVNFATAFLREDGRMAADVPMETILAHFDHLIGRLGEDGVGLGSDYDGALVPRELTGVEGLTTLRQAMLDHGYGEELMEKLCYRNWLRVLRKTWGG
ncbi:dipeptidase [Acuticoccus mangrovi]|uniref:Dipeptidase n=1 Tax=Acuticoccus mangrovi TaxID=2796142 RepID=A0A934IFK4_9HYPH|nr:dipeptidase [Acuticoccus mangrovi]MBJ3774091.1 dipeptidase [Acuticoccus mangrovi]